MRKLILNSAVSLDGYIARPDGSVDWLHDPDYELPGEDYGLGAFYETIDTTLMGNKTYQGILGFDVPFPYPDKTNFVFTRSKGQRDTEYVKFVNEDAVGFVQRQKKSVGKDIWLVGGGQINTLLLEHDLIDRIILTCIPRVLGKGIPLFPDIRGDIKFDVDATQRYSNGLVQLKMRKKAI